LSKKWVLSASEIGNFTLCRRKWAYQYLDEIKAPPSKAAQLGTALHALLEKYLSREAIDHQSSHGKIISPGLSFLPKTIAKENIEKNIFFAKHGLMFNGVVDFCEQIGDKTWLIGDHKSASNLNSSLTSEELKKNIQANIYGQWAFSEKGAERVILRWIYYRTKGLAKAHCVEAELSKAESDENFASIVQSAQEILAIVKESGSSSQQPKNTSACFAYGRCAFFDRCKNNIIAREPKKMSDPNEPEPSSFDLYVDCIATKNKGDYDKTIELSELLKPVLAKIQAEKDLSHYRLAGYGQHVGLIANYLSEHLRNQAYSHRTAILSSTKTPEGCDTLQTLTAAAGRVVRGF
jgi:hypothetical protein